MTLLPLSLPELRHHSENWNPLDLAACGCFPRLHEEQLTRRRFYSEFLQTYLERDVSSLISLKDMNLFQRFLTLVASHVGHVANYSALANDIGVSSTTIKAWVSILTASFVLFELPSYFELIARRVILSPKLYFTDPGLAAYLAGIENGEQLARSPLCGPLYENLVLLEVLKARLNRGLFPSLYFYRDTNGNEVDLIVKEGRKLVSIEIKAATTFKEEFLKGTTRFSKSVGDRSAARYLFYNGKERLRVNNVAVLNPFLHDGLHEAAIP